MDKLFNDDDGWYERDVIGEENSYVTEAAPSSFITHYTVVNTLLNPVVNVNEQQDSVAVETATRFLRRMGFSFMGSGSGRRTYVGGSYVAMARKRATKSNPFYN